MGTRLHNYKEVRETGAPRLAASLDTAPHQCASRLLAAESVAVSSVNAAMQNHVSIYEHQTRPNPALAAVHGQAALLLRYDVPTYYVSRELLAAALRTELHWAR